MINYRDIQVRFDAAEDTGVLSGYAARFNEPNSYGETLKTGAFRKTLREHAAAKVPPPMFWQHNSDEPIGVWTALSEDEQGLRVTGKLVTATTRGAEALALLKAGAISGASIGFRARAAERGPNGIRVLTDIDLVEISLVSLPSAAKARVTLVRSASDHVGLTHFTTAVRRTIASLRR